MTYESDEDGVLSILAAEGQTVPVGEPIARIATPGGRIASAGEPDEDVFDFVAGKRNEPRYDLRMMGAELYGGVTRITKKRGLMVA